MGMAPQSEVAAFFRCAGEQGRHVQDRHDGGRGHHPSAAGTGSHEPGKSLHKADGDEIQSPSTAACLRLFDRWISLAPMPTTVMAKEGAGRGIVGAITLGAESGVAAFHCCISLADRRRRRGQRGFRLPGITAPLANPRRAIDPSTSPTQPRLKRSG
jgi:hypothetical protein